jgi:hypothetical protein
MGIEVISGGLLICSVGILFEWLSPKAGDETQVSSPPRARRIGLSVVLVVLGFALTVFAIVVSCMSWFPGSLPPPEGAPPPPRASGLPAHCSSTVSDPDQATTAVKRARPGDAICFKGDRFADLTIEVTASGTPRQPISLIGGGISMRTIKVDADYVAVDGFTLTDGEGLKLKGHGIVARNNVVRNATDDGIACTQCVDVIVESNTVWRADGTGIVIDGDRSLVRDNTVSESVMRTKGDADGIRFFGTGLRLLGNTIKNIKATNYPPGQGPHTDCFQTYDTRDTRTISDVVIADNVCQNVDVQCLIATSKDRAVVPNGVTTILFEHNNCSVNGSQGILLEQFPNVVIRDNIIEGPQYRAMLVAKGSTGVTVVGNTVVGDIPPFEIDDESKPGFHAEGNTSR